jgi:tetratricopeptide (TPR) repeat protein
VLSSLQSRHGDYTARSWAAVLLALPSSGERPDDRRIILACQEGLRGGWANPYFRLYLGDAYRRLGEQDAAVKQWVLATQHAPVWPAPLTHVLAAVDSSGQLEDTRKISDYLLPLAPDDPKVLAVVAVARARAASDADTEELLEVLKLTDRVQELQAGEPKTLALRPAVLVRLGRIDEAKASVQAALGAGMTWTVEAYLALATATAVPELAMAQECYDRCLSAHGSSLELAMARGSWLVGANRVDEALKSFQAAREAAPGASNLEWRVAWARLLDQAGDSRAAGELVALAETHPDDVALQHDLVLAKSAPADAAVRGRAIDRLREIMGEDGVVWRIIEARWIMQRALTMQSPVDRDRETVRAASILNALTRRYPNQLLPHLLLSDCMSRLGNRESAKDHLATAARLAPASHRIAIQLAYLLQSMGDYSAAGRQLERATELMSNSPTATVDKEQWQRIAHLYDSRGDPARAIELLTKLTPQGAGEPNWDVAWILARRGELSGSLLRQLVEKRSLRSIELVAENYARLGRLDEAIFTLRMLRDATPHPAAGEVNLVRGFFYQRHGMFDQAVIELRQACKAMPTNTRAWRSLISSLLMLGNGADAMTAAAQAAQHAPNDALLKLLIEHGELISAAAAEKPWRAVVARLTEQDEAAEAIVEALRIRRDAIANDTTGARMIEELRRMADKVGPVGVLQNLVIDLYTDAKKYGEAALVARQQMVRQRADPVAAQRAAEVLAAAGRWDEVISVAQQWRARLGAATTPADRMLVRACQAKGALFPEARRDPASWASVIALYAQALATERPAEAEAVLAPTLGSIPESRIAWMQIAVQTLTDFDVAARWLQEVAGRIPAQARNERMVLAQSWSQLAGQSKAPVHAQRADEVLSSARTMLLDARDASADEWLVLAMVYEQRENAGEAEACYRQSLALNADHSVAKNNLAMILVRGNRNLEEALRLATEAADSPSPLRREFLDTLAQVQEKLGNSEAAKETRNLIRQMGGREADTPVAQTAP